MKSIEKIGKYLREISVVVIGVAITLFASFLLTNSNEKKDIALYLSSLKMESVTLSSVNQAKTM